MQSNFIIIIVLAKFYIILSRNLIKISSSKVWNIFNLNILKADNIHDKTVRKLYLTNERIMIELNYYEALIPFRTTGCSPLAKEIRKFLKELGTEVLAKRNEQPLPKLLRVRGFLRF